MIGKAILLILSGYTALTALIDTKIYPLVMAVETGLPAVVYAIDSVTPIYTKTGWVQDEVQFRVTSYAREYSEALDIAYQVRAALELTSGIYSSVDIQKIYMISQDEFYQLDADCFLIRMNFTVRVNNNG